MFWGLIMEPNKRYAQVVEKSFHVSQAAIDISTGDNDPCQLMVIIDGKNFLACTLQKKYMLQVPLDLYFKAGDSISFLSNGKCNIHLTGYLDPEYEEELSEDEEEEEEDEAPALVEPQKKRKAENGTKMPANKKAKKDKKAPAEDSSDEDDDDDDDDEDEDQLQKLLDGDIDTDDNDESFKMNSSTDPDDSDEEDSDEEEEQDEEEENESSDEEAKTTSKKEKLVTSKEEKLDTSKEEKLDTSNLTKSQKKRLKAKLRKEGKQAQLNGIDKKEKQPEQAKGDKKKAQKEAKEEAQAGDKKEKKALSGGVFIEDLKVGSGIPAKPGKTVMVYYEGRLKQNNKKFDDCVKGPGFKFRLGAKEVISGWDVGIAGMKVGGKRRITCPPNMAYGAKGSPPVIPPNSTLVFEVELKNVK